MLKRKQSISSTNKRKKDTSGSRSNPVPDAETEKSIVGTNKRKKKEQDTSGCNLAVDILIEILSRLPASSLLRFKFVGKPWRSLITANPHHSDLHFSRFFLSSSPSALLSIITLSYQHRQFCLNLMDADGGRQHRVFKANDTFCRISPACNGFICICSYFSTYLALFNTTTLQKVVWKPSDSRYINSDCFLGYVPTTPEYKIVWLHGSVRNLLPVLHCEVLTLGTSLWREVDYTFCPANGGVTINGVIYWVVSSLL